MLFLNIMKIKSLENKKVLVLGLGREGIDNLKFLRKVFPKKLLGVGDALRLSQLSKKTQKVINKDRKLRRHLGKDYLKALRRYDVILKTPGIPPKIIVPFLGKTKKITSQAEIFFDNCPGKIIGITGTKGKSTTTSLIYKVLKENSVKAHLVGNIGKPVLSLLLKSTPKDIYVYELSSYQLFNLKRSPHVAVLLNIFPEHLDYHRNFKEYIKAKSNITRYQNKKDFFIFNSQNKIVRQIAQKSKAKKISIDSIKVKKFTTHLLGEFNFQKIKAAFAIARIFKIPDKKIIGSIKKFKPLPHRLEYIGTYKGIKFYNDALSTIPQATIEALNTLGSKVETIFLGGYERNLSYRTLIKRILKSKIKTIILFPATGERIWREMLTLKGKRRFKVFLVQNMKDGVKLSFEYTGRGKICLLSTAAPSFSLWRDYKEKGNLFKKYVKLYGQKK